MPGAHEQSRALRVLVDGVSFSARPRGGVGRYFKEMLFRIAARNERVEFLVYCDTKGIENLPKHPRIRTFRLPSHRFRPSKVSSRVNAVRRRLLMRRLRTLRPQVFHSTYYGPPPFDGLRTVATVFDLIDCELPLLAANSPGFVALQRACLRDADRVVSISQTTAESAIAAFGLDPDKVTKTLLDAGDAFAPASDAEQERFRLAHTGGRPFVLVVGAVSGGGYKNFPVVAQALARLQGESAPVLLVAGRARRPCESWVLDLLIRAGVERRIVRLPDPIDAELAVAYSAASAFVFPSLAEGFGIPLVEAMRCGTPVVASDIPVFHEVCGDAAAYFDPHDPDALARQLKGVLNPAAARDLRGRGYERAKCFSWEQASVQLEAVYRQAAGLNR